MFVLCPEKIISSSSDSTVNVVVGFHLAGMLYLLKVVLSKLLTKYTTIVSIFVFGVSMPFLFTPLFNWSSLVSCAIKRCFHTFLLIFVCVCAKAGPNEYAESCVFPLITFILTSFVNDLIAYFV